MAVMASSINFNTVWTSIFEPLPTFGFLDRLGKEGTWGSRHALDYHVVGSDAAGVVLRTGSAVRNWKVGDKVTVQCNYVDDQDPSAHDDSMLAANQRIWGFETNFGGLADVTVVKANQLMPKPTHLSWEEAAVNALCNSTSYRMLVSHNGAAMAQGDKVLVWGASGGLGSFAVQYVLNGGGTPIGVVSSPEKVALLNDLGVDAVIDRRAAAYRFWSDEHTQDESEWRRFGRDIRELVGGEPDVVFEHPGRQTMGASVFACKRGGVIVTCAATSGYMIEYDNRHLWMKLKTIKGSHFANYREAWEANRLLCQGKILPPTLRRLHRSTMSVRPPTRCTTTGTKARSGCSAWLPRRASEWTIPSCARPWARTASTCSGGMEHERRHSHRDRPRGHRRLRPRSRHRVVPGGLRRHGGPP